MPTTSTDTIVTFWNGVASSTGGLIQSSFPMWYFFAGALLAAIAAFLLFWAIITAVKQI